MCVWVGVGVGGVGVCGVCENLQSLYDVIQLTKCWGSVAKLCVGA